LQSHTRGHICRYSVTNTRTHTHVHTHTHAHTHIHTHTHTHTRQCPANSTIAAGSGDQHECKCAADFYLEVIHENWVCSQCAPNSRSMCGSTFRTGSLHIYMYTHVHMYTHTDRYEFLMHICICMCVYVCMCVFVCVHIYTHTRIRMCFFFVNVDVNAFVFKYCLARNKELFVGAGLHCQ